MFSAAKARSISSAKDAVAILSQTVSDENYLAAAVRHAREANGLENSLFYEVLNVAENITAISGKGWDKKKAILGMWHRVARTITKFSEHMDKPVAALIINEDNELLSFSANRLLENTPKEPELFVVGGRRNFIPCAEKFAIARALKIDTEHHEIPNLSAIDRIAHIKSEVQNLSKNLLAAAQKGASFENCFILTTVPSCMSCAQAIVALKFKGVITEEGAGDHFESAKEMRKATKYLRDHHVQVIYLPKLALA